MAKKVEQLTEPVAENAPAPVAVPAVMRRFSLTLNCPTPLAYRTAVVSGINEADAKARFFDLNGISETAHPVDISEVGMDTPETVPSSAA